MVPPHVQSRRHPEDSLSDQRYVDDQRPWNSWGEAIDLKLEHQFAQHDEHGEELISRDWELPPFFLGNRFPCKKENVCECSIP